MFEQIPHPLKRAFLAAYTELGRVKPAARAAGISREAHYDWKASDPDYAEAFDLAVKLAGDELEDEAMRRAKKGVREPVYQQGHLIGWKRKYSDRLMALLLQGFKPEKYKTKTVEHKGTVRHQHAIDWSQFSDEELKTLEQLAYKSGITGHRRDQSGDGPETGPQAGPDVSGDGSAEA